MYVHLQSVTLNFLVFTQDGLFLTKIAIELNLQAVSRQ
jgi:hypothetical protein